MNKSSRRAELRLVHPSPARVGEVRPFWRRKFRARDLRVHPFMAEQRAFERKQFFAELRTASVIVGVAACAVVFVLYGPVIWQTASAAGWVRP